MNLQIWFFDFYKLLSNKNKNIHDVDSGCSNWISAARSLQFMYNVKLYNRSNDIKLKLRKHFESATMIGLKENILLDKKLKNNALVNLINVF